MKKTEKKNGFTIIELIIALSILALTLAVSGPKIQHYTKNQHVKGIARQVYSHLQLARMTAIKENLNVTITVPTERSISLIKENNDAVLRDQPVVEFDTNLSNMTVSFRTGKRLNFTAGGTATAKTIEVKSNEEGIDSYNIVVNPSGGIRFEKG